ncbi:MAG: PAS domain-containing protein [Chloroflexi bacterium]|nr:PAS domain-containing protein [Chloroflexota bacterium]
METNAQDGVADSSISEGGDGKETQAGRVVRPEKVGKRGEARKSPKAPKTGSDLLVVGIGASAGGLAPLEEMQAVNEELLGVNQALKIKIEDLSHANSDLQNLIFSNDVATIFLDRQMRVKRYTPRVANLFNIIPTDSDRPIMHITHKMLYDTLVQDAESVLSSLSQITREVQTTEGEWYIVRVLPYRTVEDRIGGVVMTFTGITEHKRVEEVLRVSEESFRAVANLAPNLLWRNDPGGKATWYNQQWLEYTGQKPEEAQGYGWLDVIHPDDREQARATFMAAIESGQPLRQEDRIRGADGSYRWFLIRAEPVLDENGKVIEWYGAATDVEEQHTALDMSEADVVSRTEDLRKLSSRLLVAQEDERRHIARELHDEIGQYLTGLRFMLEKLSTSSEQQEGTEGQIAPSLEVLSDLTERVRNLALDLRPTMLDDLGLLHALLWYVQRYQTQTGIEVSFHHMGLEGRLPTDVETAVYRVVQEALTNVARHSESRQVTLQLFSDGQVTAVIEDQGKGFDVAEAFARHTSTGLSSMRERVALVGGEFSAESSPGRGTTIIVNIPIASNS